MRTDFLRVIDRSRAPLAPSAAVRSTANGYQQEVLSFQSEPGERVPTLILKKDDGAPRRAVVIDPYLYDTVWDVMRLIDYLSTRTDVDPSRIGLVGNSRAGPKPTLQRR